MRGCDELQQRGIVAVQSESSVLATVFLLTSSFRVALAVLFLCRQECKRNCPVVRMGKQWYMKILKHTVRVSAVASDVLVLTMHVLCFCTLCSIEVEVSSKIAFISEVLCIGCGICVKKCPFEAIDIINLPKSLSKDTTHRYGPNSFKLHRLPMPRPGQVLGLVGTNGQNSKVQTQARAL